MINTNLSLINLASTAKNLGKILTRTHFFTHPSVLAAISFALSPKKSNVGCNYIILFTENKYES